MELLKPDEVCKKLGVTKDALYSLRLRSESFPKPYKLTPKVLRWDETEIDKWIQQKKESKHG
tara:strand:+ start:159 stop:344 length:186 start_codon:yes stop_codon:yes gene_type:complete